MRVRHLPAVNTRVSTTFPMEQEDNVLDVENPMNEAASARESGDTLGL